MIAASDDLDTGELVRLLDGVVFAAPIDSAARSTTAETDPLAAVPDGDDPDQDAEPPATTPVSPGPEGG